MDDERAIGPPGPRDDESGPPRPAAADHNSIPTSHRQEAGFAHSRPEPRQCAVGQAWRRRRASWRCEPLAGGHADPWRPWRERLSDRQIDGYRDAVQHLHGLGLLAAPDVEAMRQLWRRSRDDRRLVSELAERWEFVS